MKRHSGFTLVELVTIIILLGVLSIVVMVRSGGDFTALQDAEELIQATRYIQAQAMNHTGDDSNSYQITLNVQGYQLSPAPDASYADSLDGVLVGSTISPTGVITFDGRGEPSCSGGLSCSAGTRTIQLSHGSESITLSLESHTGFIRR